MVYCVTPDKGVNMSRLIIEKSHNEFVLFCNTTDRIVSEPMGKDEMDQFLLGLREFKGDPAAISDLWMHLCNDEDECYSYEQCKEADRKERSA
jgi:hypothetical protein